MSLTHDRAQHAHRPRGENARHPNPTVCKPKYYAGSKITASKVDSLSADPEVRQDYVRTMDRHTPPEPAGCPVNRTGWQQFLGSFVRISRGMGRPRGRFLSGLVLRHSPQLSGVLRECVQRIAYRSTRSRQQPCPFAVHVPARVFQTLSGMPYTIRLLPFDVLARRGSFCQELVVRYHRKCVPSGSPWVLTCSCDNTGDALWLDQSSHTTR